MDKPVSFETFEIGNGLSNKGMTAGKHPHNDGVGATTTKRGPRPAALTETTQQPGFCSSG